MSLPGTVPFDQNPFSQKDIWSPGLGVGFRAIVDVVTMMIVSRQRRERPPLTIIFFLCGDSLINMKHGETISQSENRMEGLQY